MYAYRHVMYNWQVNAAANYKTHLYKVCQIISASAHVQLIFTYNMGCSIYVNIIAHFQMELSLD